MYTDTCTLSQSHSDTQSENMLVCGLSESRQSGQKLVSIQWRAKPSVSVSSLKIILMTSTPIIAHIYSVVESDSDRASG